MKKDIVKQLVVKFGPCVSSVLAQRIQEVFPSMKADAIRQMISREKDLKRLPYIKFSHNRSFIYLKESFGDFYFWHFLKKNLHESNSVYSNALMAIINNGDFVRKRDFGIICGSPIKQLKHISHYTVADNLLKSRLLKLVNVDGVGECFVLNYNDVDIDRVKNEAHTQIFFEKPIAELVKVWLKNTGLVAYNQVKTKFDELDNPVVGSFEWCIGSPSYVHPLVEYVGNDFKPGFVACDFIFGYRHGVVNGSLASCIIKKVELTLFSRRKQRFMFIVFARKFSPEAFSLLRNKGILAITMANAFGSKIDESINDFSKVVTGALSIDRHPEELLSILENFESISGENGNLRGYLFELFVSSYIEYFYGRGIVTLNKTYKDGDNEAEADVVLETNSEIIVVECKNKKHLPSEDVTDWLKKRIPRINSYYKKYNPEGKKIKHFLWVTGSINSEDVERLSLFKNANKKQEINFLFDDSLVDFLMENKTALSIYNKVIVRKK